MLVNVIFKNHYMPIFKYIDFETKKRVCLYSSKIF